MMEDETTPPVPPPSERERTEAEDLSPQDAPADPADDPDTEAAGGEPAEEDGVSSPAPRERQAAGELPRTTTTGDDDQDLRSAGDGAVSGAPGDDLGDAAQRHD